jgi:hypothetical protein
MGRDRWEQIERLYHASLERGTDARDAFLDDACAGDEDLRREVAGLLACDIPTGELLVTPGGCRKFCKLRRRSSRLTVSRFRGRPAMSQR